ncbi:MAG: glutamate 5-kinase [Dehalococcoidia bacterium]|nr:glutamate 5-kinase [Dehalococcoidia bacterium]MQG15454.1 glutamate 5-kinase [SAR202 cluster bacterium]|tara:strand:- start:55346 stop:56509 length:1164 start_codon:yes stop_codon:yes gene_type:complete
MSSDKSRKNLNKPLLAKRIVVKIGSALLTHKTEAINKAIVESLANEIAMLSRTGIEVILVSSGAIASGRIALNISDKIHDVSLKQVLAAVGQGLLLQLYEQTFKTHNIRIAQALLTRHDMEERLGYLNVRNTLLKLIELKVIPIVNENDVVNIEQLSDKTIGDNDTLSALVANLVDADLLIMLGKLDGLYSNDPHLDKSARFIPSVDNIDETILSMGGDSWSEDGVAVGYGGMSAKLQAAKMVTSAGATAIMASGLQKDILTKLMSGENLGTRFSPTGDRIESRKRWMLSGIAQKGNLTIDSGASGALRLKTNSLLPAGVLGVTGSFSRGDVVTISDESEIVIAAGISNYNSEEIDQVKGKHSEKIRTTLGYDYGDEIVHRSNMVKL